MLPKLLRFIVPLTASSLLQLAFNAADLIVVGRFGRPTALAAVGSNVALVSLVVNTFMGLAVGGGVLCARFFGAKDRPRLTETVSTALIAGFLGGFVLGALGIVLAMPLLRLISTPDDVAPLAAVYLKVYFAGMPVIALYNFASALLRAMGDTRRPFYFLAAAGVLNVLLNLFFVIVLGIDVAGVALATVLSQCLSCFLTVRCLLRSTELKPRELRFSGGMFRDILRIGLPAGIQGSMYSIANFVIQGAVNSFGAAVITGSAACSSLEGFLFCPVVAVHASGGAHLRRGRCADLPLPHAAAAAVYHGRRRAGFRLRAPADHLPVLCGQRLHGGVLRRGARPGPQRPARHRHLPGLLRAAHHLDLQLLRRRPVHHPALCGLPGLLGGHHRRPLRLLRGDPEKNARRRCAFGVSAGDRQIRPCISGESHIK